MRGCHGGDVIVLLCVIMFVLVTSQASGIESGYCKTLHAKVIVSKEKTYEYNGRKVRLVCRGNIRMTKCEGLCTSRVSPSVVTFPGFRKDCKCCRESRLEDREVTLAECYDGRMLVPGQFTRMHIREPISCQCYDCAI